MLVLKFGLLVKEDVEVEKIKIFVVVMFVKVVRKSGYDFMWFELLASDIVRVVNDVASKVLEWGLCVDVLKEVFVKFYGEV